MRKPEIENVFRYLGRESVRLVAVDDHGWSGIR